MLNKAAKYRVGGNIKVLIFAIFKIQLWLNGWSELSKNFRGCSLEGVLKECVKKGTKFSKILKFSHNTPTLCDFWKD